MPLKVYHLTYRLAHIWPLSHFKAQGSRVWQVWPVNTVKHAKYAFARCGVATYHDQELENGNIGDLTMSECVIQYHRSCEQLLLPKTLCAGALKPTDCKPILTFRIFQAPHTGASSSAVTLTRTTNITRLESLQPSLPYVHTTYRPSTFQSSHVVVFWCRPLPWPPPTVVCEAAKHHGAESMSLVVSARLTDEHDVVLAPDLVRRAAAERAPAVQDDLALVAPRGDHLVVR